jgi:hypothetical protein
MMDDAELIARAREMETWPPGCLPTWIVKSLADALERHAKPLPVAELCTDGPPMERKRQWRLQFDDPDKGYMIFDSEAEAMRAWDRAKDNWTCTLFVTAEFVRPNAPERLADDGEGASHKTPPGREAPLPTDVAGLVPELLVAEQRLGGGWPWGDLLSRAASLIASQAREIARLKAEGSGLREMGVVRAEAAEALAAEQAREIERLRDSHRVSDIACEAAEARVRSLEDHVRKHEPSLDRIKSAHSHMTMESMKEDGHLRHRVYTQGQEEGCYLCALVMQVERANAELAAIEAATIERCAKVCDVNIEFAWVAAAIRALAKEPADAKG